MRSANQALQLTSLRSQLSLIVGLAIFFGNEFSAGEIVQRFPRV
jgi:hypothetical protein